MLLDAQNLFSDSQQITTGTIISTNTIRFGQGDISYLPFLAQVVEDFSDLTSLTLKIQTSEDENFENAKTLIESTMELAELKAGNRFPISQFPKGNKGYIRVVYSVEADENVTETTGKITSGVTLTNME